MQYSSSTLPLTDKYVILYIYVHYHCINIFILKKYDHTSPVELLDDAKVGWSKVNHGREKLKVVRESLSV